MNWKTTSLFLLSAMVITSCADETSQETTPENNDQEIPVSSDESLPTLVISEDVSADDFNRFIAEKPGVVLDVRTIDEYEGGHIDNAVNMDFYGENFEKELETLDKSTPVHVYCQGGGRSGKTKKMLTDKGFVCVYNLADGYGNWHP